ncbi:PepSY domain-containing protein [Planomicrobium sp. CPCC 101110]|uniref:PepSY domain-containing protein n=1 Tax=Planomicrobium sp. CPCC 101110 TaxID=2599619 RepID=UPI0016481CB8|nr:PepSY domain-containing protein [Planomicrobium sp. CPCC 101110]
MRNRLLVVLATVFLGALVLVLLLNSHSGEEEISAEDAETKVMELYGGEVEETLTSSESYEIRIVREDGRYTAQVDRQTGRIGSMELNEKTKKSQKLNEEEASAIALQEVEGEAGKVVYSKENNEFNVEVIGAEKISTVIIAADTGEVRKITNEAVETDPVSEPVITQEEAIGIAKKTLDGEVGEVDFVDSEDGGYYLIDIENEETEQEVLVQIHAIRGETMTVEWDD